MTQSTAIGWASDAPTLPTTIKHRATDPATGLTLVLDERAYDTDVTVEGTLAGCHIYANPRPFRTLTLAEAEALAVQMAADLAAAGVVPS